MSTRNFNEMLRAKWAEGKFVCVGLDSELARIPESVRFDSDIDRISDFNRQIVDATKDIVGVYKPNIAFYEAEGNFGLGALSETIAYINTVAPGIPVILDAKRGDIGKTNAGYVRAAFERLNADAVTVSPYFGREALQPFLDRPEKGIIVLCRTSNKGADEFQDRQVIITKGDVPESVIEGSAFPEKDLYWTSLYKLVASNVSRKWNANGNCAIVAGVNADRAGDELANLREIVGDMPMLIPGIGTQGGDLEATIKAGKDSQGKGMIINSSSSIIFASSGGGFAEAARRETLKLHEAIQKCLK